jgi:hypothetical protein
MHPSAVTIKEEGRGARIRRGQQLMAAGGLLGALAATTKAGYPSTPRS